MTLTFNNHISCHTVVTPKMITEKGKVRDFEIVRLDESYMIRHTTIKNRIK